jgi:hypothetical protein
MGESVLQQCSVKFMCFLIGGSLFSVAACAAPSDCFIYMISGGPKPMCAMTVANGPSGDDAIGSVPAPAILVQCPAEMIRHRAPVPDASGGTAPIEFYPIDGTRLHTSGPACFARP